MSSKPLIFVTIGDPCGIGPEVVAKALAQPKVYRLCRPVVIGSGPIMKQAVELTKVPLQVRQVNSLEEAGRLPDTVDLLDPGNLNPSQATPGRVVRCCGKGQRGVGAEGWGAHPGRKGPGHGHRPHQ